MRRDILTVGLTILGVYFFVNGVVTLIPAVASYLLAVGLDNNSQVHVADGPLQMKMTLVYLVGPVSCIVVGLLLIFRHCRKTIVNLLDGGDGNEPPVPN